MTIKTFILWMLLLIPSTIACLSNASLLNCICNILFISISMHQISLILCNQRRTIKNKNTTTTTTTTININTLLSGLFSNLILPQIYFLSFDMKLFLFQFHPEPSDLFSRYFLFEGITILNLCTIYSSSIVEGTEIYIYIYIHLFLL